MFFTRLQQNSVARQKDTQVSFRTKSFRLDTGDVAVMKILMILSRNHGSY